MNEFLIFDMDDTIFETKSIGEEPVKPILDKFEHLLIHRFGTELAKEIVAKLWKYPFDVIADTYKFDEYQNSEFARLVNENEYNLKVQPFEDFNLVKNLKQEKVLVTTGFSKLQNAKIQHLGLEKEFNKIYIDDILDPKRIFKKGIFKNILLDKNIKPEFVYIVGDNPHSELKAGFELGLNTIQVAKFGQKRSEYANYYISNFKELIPILAVK
ncbi:HAD family hydrolase [Aquimarina celericrescens]|uniref:HAD family hydrolase n=1 Tax=Aquimarina celericrescens TaxID=1964542 RepID=A0ABW5AYD4_9FLAO|nr:HAD family hydrolase [Aquimarina celericrescens]